MITLHKLSGQNLVRHKMLEETLGNKLLLLSDSISVPDLISVLLSRKPLAVHSLEIYLICYRGCISEYFSLMIKEANNLLYLLKKLFGLIKALIKVYLMRCALNRATYIFVSSEIRKKYIIKDFKDKNIRVIRNKPYYTEVLHATTFQKKNIIVLIGSLNNRDDFKKICSFSDSNHIEVVCYGISTEDEKWIRNEPDCSKVKIEDNLSSKEVPCVLINSKYAMCLYRSNSINQKFSASSKIYELIYHGCIPIVSDNIGLINQLKEINASFVNVNNLEFGYISEVYNCHLIGSNVCTFNSELISIKEAK